MKQIVLGLSGGVDSAVAALLLREEGYDVTAVTIHTGFGADVRGEAAALAERLSIPHVIADVSDPFRRLVTERFARVYLSGCMPNPCVICNPLIKWQAMAETADSLGIRELATGHYSAVIRLENGRFAVQKAPWKDQSYVLYGLSQEQLSRTHTVLSGYSKEEIRAIAEKEQLEVAQKPDSQEICFVPDGDYASFIEGLTGLTSAPGSFVDPEGRVLGTHKGLIHYTVGQRKGLGLAFGEPRFVTELRPAANEVVLGRGEDCFARGFLAEELNFQETDGEELFSCDERLLGKIRYAHREAPCRLHRLPDGRAECFFDEPQRAITPGQSAVWYRDGHVYGGGIVTEVIR